MTRDAMAIRFACDACGRAYELPEAAIGRQAKCECGEMLVVPAKSTLVIPPPVPASKPSPAKKEERPPRTLHQAAEVARKKREAEELNEARLAAMASKPKTRESKPTQEASVQPPPLPPPLEMDIQKSPIKEPLRPDPDAMGYQRKVRKYRSLRAYCFYLRVLSIVIGIAMLALTAIQVLAAAPIIGQIGNDFLRVLVVLSPACFTFFMGILGFVFLNAIAEFFHVLMDIEENTRPTT